jgi:hypothetical protein
VQFIVARFLLSVISKNSVSSSSSQCRICIYNGGKMRGWGNKQGGRETLFHWTQPLSSGQDTLTYGHRHPPISI